uniref:WD repeat protein 13 n=1 Tax=Schistosoma japonicum TaxID=6182 RepID=C1L3V3_SCHJA|nr:WD repeat protein 13 [Schistosoma japonicum]
MSCDVWQQVLALDSRYSAIRPVTKSSAELRQLYLRRRNQLTREKSALSISESFGHPNFSCSYQYATETSLASFATYRNIREQLLLILYGPVKTHKCPSPQSSLNKTRSFDESIKQPSSWNYPMTKSECDMSSDYPASGKVETLGESYAFSGIEHIFDHHSGAVNRLSFANHDSSRLAMASSDGTISICHIPPASGCFSISCVLPECRVKQTEITDIAWSMTNEFLLSTSLDGNICFWDVEEAKLAREYLSKDLKLGPLLTCAFQPANNNIFAVGSVMGIVQMVNLSTGKVCVRGMDRVHITARGNKTCLNSSIIELRSLLGTGCVTTLAFENASGNYLWVGTDRGIIQSYVCEPSTGSITRSQRFDISSLNMSAVLTYLKKGVKLNDLLHNERSSTLKTYFLSKADHSFTNGTI